jgi:hypothetical protein
MLPKYPVTISTRSAKSKGVRLQNLTRDRLRADYPDLDPDDIKGAIMGSTGEDLVLSPAAKKRIGISVECKARAAIAVGRWYEQAQKNSQGREPVVIMKEDRHKPLVLVDADHYFDLLSRDRGTV